MTVAGHSCAAKSGKMKICF